MSKNLIKKFQNFSHQHNLWQEGSKIILGVSGGPDSVCLLDIFAKLKDKYNLDLIVAHVNYGLRGKDSDKDEKFVRGLAKEHGIKIEVFHPYPSLTPSPSSFGRGERVLPSENALRSIRYDFFEKARAKNNFDLIAVAHTKDDQVETVLMRLIRGAGLKGLRAMRPKTEKIIRPLLGAGRKEILAYLKENKLNYRTDITNKDNRIFRNRIRNLLIPYLEKNFNPSIKDTLASETVIIADDYDYIKSEAEKKYKKVKIASQGRQIVFSNKELRKTHPSIQREIFRMGIMEVKRDIKDIRSANIKEAMEAFKSGKGKNQKVAFQGLKMIKRGDKIQLSLDLFERK